MKILVSQLTDYQRKLLTDDEEERQISLNVPDDYIQNLVSNVLERSYLENISNISNLPYIEETKTKWLMVRRLPVPPGKIEEYSLLPRWQSTLSTIHALNRKLIYILLRQNAETNLYLGLEYRNHDDIYEVEEQLFQSVTCQMPGIELKKVEDEKDVRDLLQNYNASGTVTGIPSPRKEINYGMFQTMDQVAFGIRNLDNEEKDFAVIMISDPVKDSKIAELIRTLRNLGSEIHTFVHQTEQHGENQGNAMSFGVSAGIGSLISLLTLGGNGGAALGGLLNLSSNTTTNIGRSESVSRQYLNKSAQYCEQLLDKHIERLQHGRSLGFWNTGIYVLSQEEGTVLTVMGMLRSIYSGDNSYMEPIRTSLFPRNSGADIIIKNCALIPIHRPSISSQTINHQWHPFGTLFEYITTPLNTEELSITTSLPRRDVPGLRFVRNAVRFASNPPMIQNGEKTIEIGNVLDTGISVGQSYRFELKNLVKHGLITGITGSGKSTTCRNLLSKIKRVDIPFLIIEPAKEEYVRWAIGANHQLAEDNKIKIYMPGVAYYEDYLVDKLKINPFQPAACKGGQVNMMARLDRFKAAMIASLPMADVLPIIIEEALYNHVIRMVGEQYLINEFPENEVREYPLIGTLHETAGKIIDARGYEKTVAENIKAAVKTRINALIRGFKRDILNVTNSMDYRDLFERNVVINLSKIADNRDKAIIMSLVFMALCEYRESKYINDSNYRQKADSGALCHIALIEEAHRLLANPGVDMTNSGNPQAVVSSMFSEMLSEIRAYGQGLLIVDQVPSRLIPDAIKNTNIKITHRIVAADDRRAMASCMGLRPEQEEIISVLQPGEAIICSDYDDAATWIKVNHASF
ncbi:MAG: ATP-binding protein [Thermotaleaceae bacterium]